MASDACESVSDCQVTPPSVVFHTPPCAAPIKTVLPVASVGSIAITSTRPEVLPDDPAKLPAAGADGCGPIGRHIPVNGACGGCESGRGAESSLTFASTFASCLATHVSENTKVKVIAAKILTEINKFLPRLVRVGIFSPEQIRGTA